MAGRSTGPVHAFARLGDASARLLGGGNPRAADAAAIAGRVEISAP